MKRLIAFLAAASLCAGTASAVSLPAAAVRIGIQTAFRVVSQHFPPEEAAVVSDVEDVQAQLHQAITSVSQPPPMDVSALGGEREALEMAVQNAYYALTAAEPALKYAYDLQFRWTEDGLLVCTVSYMPYRTGAYPDGFSGAEAGSLAELAEVASAGLDSPSIPVRITDPSLTVDDLNRSLQQCGGSYLLCQLNRDGTAVTVTPLNGMTHDEALARLAEIDRLAAQVVETETDDAMTPREKALALYTYVTETVRYDHRYYADRASMPYDSQTAYGALHDGLAICGGYAQALQVLFQQAGIPCFTVSGTMGSEYHMWNVARLDGQWRYFDATSDRGRADYWFNCFDVPAEQLANYTWNTGLVEQLTADVP